MRTENLFKFVAIRGPEPQAETPAPVRGPGGTFTAQVRQDAATGSSLPDARRRRAAEFMDSDEYVMRNPAWKAFLAIETWVRRLLAEISPGEDLRSALAQLLATPLGQTMSLEAFVGGELFKQLKQSLWDSYYCTVILPERRPQDRPRILFWIRFWRLLERLANGEQAPALLAEMSRWTPGVPHILVRSDGPQRPASQPEEPRLSNRRAQIAQQTTIVNGLRAAQAQIRKALRTRDLRPSGPPQTAGVANAAAETVRLGPQRRAGMSGPPRPPTPRLSDSLDAQTQATLTAQGLSVDDDAASLLEQVGHGIAVAVRRIDELRQVEQLAFVRGALVVRRRTLTDDELEGADER